MFYKIVIIIMRLYLRIFNRWTIIGRENIPQQGPLVLIGNHVSYWDPVILACSVNREVHFMAKTELFNVPIFRQIIKWLHAFPVKRGSPDRNALRTSSEILNNGKVLALFPEGTRSKTGELLPFQPGAALLALRAKAPIVPIMMLGSRSTFPLSIRGKIEVRIGEPMYFNELVEQKVSGEELEKASLAVREKMLSLSKEVQRS
ncbi:MAG: lysophospholipid acyltransferase family protein [Peptococcia bacterium]|jgi:1-acyl-sn-glycerol-3-phosphate acyltransferase